MNDIDWTGKVGFYLAIASIFVAITWCKWSEFREPKKPSDEAKPIAPEPAAKL